MTITDVLMLGNEVKFEGTTGIEVGMTGRTVEFTTIEVGMKVELTNIEVGRTVELTNIEVGMKVEFTYIEVGTTVELTNAEVGRAVEFTVVVMLTKVGALVPSPVPEGVVVVELEMGK